MIKKQILIRKFRHENSSGNSYALLRSSKKNYYWGAVRKTKTFLQFTFLKKSYLESSYLNIYLHPNGHISFLVGILGRL